MVPRISSRIQVELPSECWLWTGAKTPNGYAKAWFSGRLRLVHRELFERQYGPIPAGLELDHLCRVRHCVNPKHLEPVTRRENQLRGNGVGGRHARQTHCSRGHAFTEANTLRVSTRPNTRQCRICYALRRHLRADQAMKDAE